MKLLSHVSKLHPFNKIVTRMALLQVRSHFKEMDGVERGKMYLSRSSNQTRSSKRFIRLLMFWWKKGRIEAFLHARSWHQVIMNYDLSRVRQDRGPLCGYTKAHLSPGCWRLLARRSECWSKSLDRNPGAEPDICSEIFQLMRLSASAFDR